MSGPGTISGSDVAIHATKVHARNLTLEGNDLGIVASRAVVADMLAVDNDVALFIYERVRAMRITASENLYAVLSYRSARVAESVLTGNAWDIATVLPPRVSTTSCGLSAQLVLTSEPGIYAPGPSWGVCVND